jgi:hypothetical protein
MLEVCGPAEEDHAFAFVFSAREAVLPSWHRFRTGFTPALLSAA